MDIEILKIFQGLDTLVHSWSAQPDIAIARVGLILLGFLLIYLGKKGVLEALLMIPMGLGMAAVNAGVMFVPEKMVSVQQVADMTAAGTDLATAKGTLFLNPLASDPDKLMGLLQIDWMQPIYAFTFSNGLIACMVFMGIGTLLDVGFVMARPFKSMFIALCGELGTVIVFPLAVLWGLPLADAAATATIGGADGPMILFAALMLSDELFVPITVVAYLYLGLTYGGYPYMIKALVPPHIRGLKMPAEKTIEVTSGEKMVFAVLACVLLCMLFPVAAPLFLSLFIGVVIRESGLTHYNEVFSTVILYTATFFLGLLLGVLCEASVILDPSVIKLLVLGITALFFSGLGGLMGGYIMYFATGKQFNPAAVSCVPTTAKVAQKTVSEVNPESIILPQALGASISGVITSAIFAGVLITIVRAAYQSAGVPIM